MSRPHKGHLALYFYIYIYIKIWGALLTIFFRRALFCVRAQEVLHKAERFLRLADTKMPYFLEALWASNKLLFFTSKMSLKPYLAYLEV